MNPTDTQYVVYLTTGATYDMTVHAASAEEAEQKALERGAPGLCPPMRRHRPRRLGRPRDRGHQVTTTPDPGVTTPPTDEQQGICEDCESPCSATHCQCPDECPAVQLDGRP